MNSKEEPILLVPFPEGYEHFRDMANFTATRLRHLDEQIKALPVGNPRDSSFKLRFNPTALQGELTKWHNRGNRQLLEVQKDEIEKQTMQRMEVDILRWDVDPQTADKIRTATIDTLHPNAFAGKSKEELLKDRSTSKDINYSQNYMRALLKSNYNTTDGKKVHQIRKSRDLDRS